MKHDASLRFLSSATRYHEDAERNEEDSSGNRITFNNLIISADGSSVRLPAFLQVQALTFNINNKSKLLISSGLKYGQLSASVSDDSEVQAPWRLVKELRIAAENN